MQKGAADGILMRMSSTNTTRCALITGGARRVGRAVAVRLADAGYDIAITYLTSVDETAHVVSQIQTIESDGRRRRALAIRADLTDPINASEDVSRQIQDQFGRLDVLVNSASIYEPTDFTDIDLISMRRMFAIHVEAPLLLSHRLATLLAANPTPGRIINMSDLLAERPWSQYMAYCATKAALSSLTMSLARQLAPRVTVNAIAPGVVEWPDDFPPHERDQYLQRVPLRRPGCADDVAELVHFLATSGSYITGQVIHLDGGRSIT